jgi:hypothetical protein
VGELREAIEVIIDREAARVGRGDGTAPVDVDAGCRKVIANLCAIYPGTTPEYWQWSHGRAEAVDWIIAHHAQHETAGKKINNEDPVGLAFRRFIEAKAQIIAEHRGRAA